ncbi:MAG: DUF1365 domain-containing protein [Pelagibacteraceae bacterium]|jgi:DUF1365 family protein|nr:DUF1365 domain-containing protein [Pelagibacteraceae bacterium]|tara:strand:+ start:4275 stop:5033 length:759 start_codon:yes stop_codon:yes gene_type:complete
MNSCIYNGEVNHTRFKPVKHFLNYKTFSLFIDLDEIEQLDKSISIFSHNKFNIFSFYNKDHGDRDGSCLKEWVRSNLKKYKIEGNISKIKMLCYPRIFGYVFNPLSIFYCYENDKLKSIFYEVKNTFNEQHTYIFKIKDGEEIKQKCKKKFYVSPFMDMETFYNFKLIDPNQRLSVMIKQTDAEGTVLTATQTGDKKEFNFKQLLVNFFRYPLMTFKIISSIHYEALLLWKKGAIYRKRVKKVFNNISYEEY